MYTRVRLFCLIIVLFTIQSTHAISYYIDSAAGNDSNNGTTLTTAWKNITKLNTLTLTAGTKVFLRCGSVWNGQQLKFSGSGSSLFPIVIDQYGTGAKPILNGNGLFGSTSTTINDANKQGVIYLYNQDYIEINNLEITNYPPLTLPATNPDSLFFIGLFGNGNNPKGADRRGIMVAVKDKVNSSTNSKVCNHIYFKNIDIHHVKGQLGTSETVFNGAIPKQTGGIYFVVLNESAGSDSRFNDLLVENCTIAYCENIGIALDNEDNVYYPGGTEYANWFKRRFTNVNIKSNVIHHIGKNAMIIRCTDETGLIERNVCYETALGTTGNTMFTARAKGTVFQYNEGSFNRAATQQIDPGNIDGCMYDPDFGSIGVIFQYSYSHDNSHGIYWGCNTRSSSNNTSGIPDPEDVGCTLRYCISQNDKGNLVYFNYSSAGNEIYNNVFYIKSGLSPTIIKENSANRHTYNFYNNIIYNIGTGSYNFGNDVNYPQTRTIQNNVFYGYHHSAEPADVAKITQNPQFVSPGSGTTGLSSLDGYKLLSTSPVLTNGKIIVSNGGKDFYGTTLPTTAPCRGVYQGTGVSLDISYFNSAENDIVLYPNPVNEGIINVKIPQHLDLITELSIINVLGQELFQIPISNKEAQIQLPSNLNGTFFIQFKNGIESITKRIIVNP
ncbi:MAG: hypothetical protein CFE24_06400 [Flavobacterium sp. BFFFF2]|nr:MAG: hypothetical protein CFE24_06400 [Flavobacterium sp. BFFFF2]